jgi:isopentenyl diphosphate isomerase/L-lactate dehydrogenase-like FMN-dependent dehydrogenase
MTRNIAKRQRVRVADARIFHAQFNWRDVERIKKGFDIPLILKGIDTAEDAKIAVEHRVGCVYVSNHGGRQPDQGVGSIDVLPEVVDAVGGHARIIVDGGIGRGADAVACGRAGGCLGSSTAMTRASAATRRMPRTGRGRGGA